eukprot:TRINITY_DN39950_c0_g1_i6.p1 TRINITY_DN39950_c0_g1~~TRINITY_DN39950_c0_g1_i6.p1  ORF type:complete len:175 (+),score=34.62 TRINITY_DN39950_c0_g1_i6:296-820(+)
MSLEVFVKTLEGRTLAFDAKYQDTVESLHRRVQETTGTTGQWHLISAGKKLDLDRTLMDYNLRGNRTLHYVPRLSVQRKNVLRFSGQEFAPSQLQQPLSETGITAESAVELLHVPRLPTEVLGSSSASSGGLPIYVSAPALGKADPVCVELPPDATLGDLVLAAATQLELPVPQ